MIFSLKRPELELILTIIVEYNRFEKNEGLGTESRSLLGLRVGREEHVVGVGSSAAPLSLEPVTGLLTH